MDFLHEQGELVVGTDDGLQIADVRAVAVEFVELRDDCVGERDADVVDGWCRGWIGGLRVGGGCAVDVGRIYADCVGELDGWEWLEVLNY